LSNLDLKHLKICSTLCQYSFQIWIVHCSCRYLAKSTCAFQELLSMNHWLPSPLARGNGATRIYLYDGKVHFHGPQFDGRVWALLYISESSTK
ncbi:hypothetical protein NC652_006820, partial [Populus alba x Populus x berolinensis]